MAAAASSSSASAVTALLPQILPVRSKSLASSTSLFFSSNDDLTRIGRRLSITASTKRRRLSCNSLFGLGVPEVAVIGGVAALVFGPQQLPQVGRSIGKTVKSFQQAAKEFETELRKEGEASAEDGEDKVAIAVVADEDKVSNS